ncbi:DUF6875 domain-containing protein [Streptomyces harbinensis]|uniref:DUF6875 domain-containing protein n=1 Tax=Streptomyces harbinensis TaxID=1176198 RepID=UPI003712DDEF
MHPFIPLTAEQEAALSGWLTGYVTAPHPELGRDGPVCPFVAPARRSGVLHGVRCRWLPGDGAPRMTALIRTAMDAFEERYADRPTSLDSLIVVFDGLRAHQWHLIDDVYEEVKDEAVSRGLMLGQMHPKCDARAARNPAFPANRSPLPQMVVRRMAFHDILFLHHRPDWFTTYQEHYGHLYRSPDRVDPHYVRLFDSGALVAAGGSLV